MSISIEQILLRIVITFLAWVTVGLIGELEALRSHIARADTAKSNGLPQGSVAPELDSSDLWSGEHLGKQALSGRTNLFVFISAFCPTCREIPGSLKSLLALGFELNVIIICSGKPEDCQFVCESLRHSVKLICDGHADLARAFRVVTVPTAVVLDESLVVKATAHAVTARDFTDLVSGHIRQDVAPS